MFRSKREKAFFAETQKFFPATAIYNAFRHNLINPSKILPEQKKKTEVQGERIAQTYSGLKTLPSTEGSRNLPRSLNIYRSLKFLP